MSEFLQYKPTGEIARAVGVEFRDGIVYVTLEDGRVIGNPLSWYGWLENARPEQLLNIQMGRDAVHWTALDEALDIEAMLRGSAAPNKSEQTEKDGAQTAT